MNGNVTNGEVPLGLGMALAENTAALTRFAALSPQQRQELIHQAHGVQSKEEMQQLVASLVQTNQ